jgi:3-oxoacyl-[acyl-carrier-protein] synthase III
LLARRASTRGRCLNPVYVTSTGRFLPGPAITNDEIENVLGRVGGKPSRLKNRILKANGIATRHYAIDRDHRTIHSNTDMAVRAARDCLVKSSLPTNKIGMLSCATTQGDLVVPGFGSMVQAGLDMPQVELHTAHGICSSAAMAVKAAFNTLRTGDQASALVVTSEFASRLFKHTRYEAAGGADTLDFDAEFLRWMLSDGAGAWLLESRPRSRCLRIDWIRSFSHADSLPVCMSIGSPKARDDSRTWQDFATYAEAEAAGALLIRQDVRLLEHIVKLGVDGALRLIDEGVLNVARLDYLLCHYSSHHFRAKIHDLLKMCGAAVPYEKWYTNLYTRGNTGCASIMIMLDEFLQLGKLQPGNTLLCMVPESGRFNVAYMHMTVMDSQ